MCSSMYNYNYICFCILRCLNAVHQSVSAGQPLNKLLAKLPTVLDRCFSLVYECHSHLYREGMSDKLIALTL